jgi:alpha-1,3/alpha-1,6-mannosyltransferase
MASLETASSSAGSRKKRNIIFIHPDLGIGGAERLIIDAAVGLQNLGHKVTIFTSHCDPKHCFEEARDGMVESLSSYHYVIARKMQVITMIILTGHPGTLDVRVRGHTAFPPTILSRFHILLATLRQIHLVFSICLFTNELVELKAEVFIVDQLSACVPLLRWLWPRNQRLLFYCHFPDQLLARRDEKGALGMVKRLYRWPFDWFEGWSMSGSDRVIVNSRFTKRVVEGLFGRNRLGQLRVVYPCVNTEAEQVQGEDEKPLWKGKRALLSINRFERKKDVGLAIRAFQGLSPDQRKCSRLVIAGMEDSTWEDENADVAAAGGYDSRVAENVQYHKELESEASSLGLSHATAKTVPTALAIPADIEVLFLLSVPGPFKSVLLGNAKLLIYTPTKEHFGIVPVEAMQHGVPVLAANTGGPLETVLDGETGWLRDVKDIAAWTDVMRRVIDDENAAKMLAMGHKGRRRVESEFSRFKMAQRFEDEVQDMMDGRRKAFIEWNDIVLGLGVMGIFVAALVLTVVTSRRQAIERS